MGAEGGWVHHVEPNNTQNEDEVAYTHSGAIRCTAVPAQVFCGVEKMTLINDTRYLIQRLFSMWYLGLDLKMRCVEVVESSRK
jgi:hypothetical protein